MISFSVWISVFWALSSLFLCSLSIILAKNCWFTQNLFSWVGNEYHWHSLRRRESYMWRRKGRKLMSTSYVMLWMPIYPSGHKLWWRQGEQGTYLVVHGKNIPPKCCAGTMPPCALWYLWAPCWGKAGKQGRVACLCITGRRRCSAFNGHT